MCLNGASYNNAELKRMAGYVIQDDLLNWNLTVYETLMFTAELRLSRNITGLQRQQRFEEVLVAMGISHVKNVIVVTVMKKRDFRWRMETIVCWNATVKSTTITFLE